MGKKTTSLIIKNEEGKELTVVTGSNEYIAYLLDEAGVLSNEEEEFLQD